MLNRKVDLRREKKKRNQVPFQVWIHSNRLLKCMATGNHQLEMFSKGQTENGKKKSIMFLLIRNLIFKQSAPASALSTLIIYCYYFVAYFGNEPNGDNHQGWDGINSKHRCRRFGFWQNDFDVLSMEMRMRIEIGMRRFNTEIVSTFIWFSKRNWC